MKKKHIVISILCGLLALVIGVLAVTLTTPLSYELNSDKFDKLYNPYGPNGEVVPTPLSDVDWFFMAKNCGKTMNLAYRINPSISNLKACYSIYRYKNYIYGNFYGYDMPDDFVTNCVKYTKAVYETPYEKLQGNITYVPIGNNMENQMKLTFGMEYALALYFDGQVKQSQALVDELMTLVDTENIAFSYTLKDYFYYVNATTADKAVESWVLEKETAVEQLIKDSGKLKAFYEMHDRFFSNPDLTTYVNGDWEEYRESD